MSAPSSQMPLFCFSDPHLQARASFAPASSSFDSSYTTWSSTGLKRTQSLLPVLLFLIVQLCGARIRLDRQ